MNQLKNTPASLIVRIKDLRVLCGLSRSTVYNKLDPKSKYYDPNFPRPVSLGARSVGFRRDEVEQYIDSLGHK
ncbi:AlpA family phage regulatory protein [Methylotuvimicrobium sp. KM2]|uniref:helix-turn-helix transcriptional regulator n=1 Tax=Methylotuvimicrobium sp. KM2 TaxID=3133976 RepID=UPI003100D847